MTNAPIDTNFYEPVPVGDKFRYDRVLVKEFPNGMRVTDAPVIGDKVWLNVELFEGPEGFDGFATGTEQRCYRVTDRAWSYYRNSFDGSIKPWLDVLVERADPLFANEAEE